MALFQRVRKSCRVFLHHLFRGNRFPVFLGLLSSAFTLWIYTTSQPAVSSLLDRLDNLVYDLRYSFMLEQENPAQHKIVIVDYDQKSLDAEGQWPWSRFKLGDLVNQLREYGVIVVGFDVFFPETERNLVTELAGRIESDRQVRELLPELDRLEGLLDADRYFAEQMSRTEVILGFSFLPNQSSGEGVLPDPIIQLDDNLAGQLALPEMQGYVGNVEVLQEGAAGAGFFDTLPDIDGVIRRTPLVMEYRDRLYPSLALEMARLYYFEDNFTLETEADSLGRFRNVTGIHMGSVFIPTDERGQVLVPYIGPSRLGEGDTYRYISATDVLNDNLTGAEREALTNSLVLIGSTATGLFDLRATPLESVYPGVEVHANVLNAILKSTPMATVDGSRSPPDGTGQGMAAVFESFQADGISPFPVRPDWEEGAVIVLLALLGLLLSLIYPFMGPALLTLSSLAFISGITALNFRIWRDYNLDISLVIILFLVLLVTVVNMAYGFLREGLSRRALKGMFGQYVPPAHIDAMLDDPDKYDFEGESRDMTVLFSDIRNFTSISESLSASQLKTVLNDFFTPITGVIFEHQGTIDKYVGDMVMAFWGAPLDDSDHHQHAVDTALHMLEKVEELKAQFRVRGLPEISVGIGINSGQMNVGDMGSTYRRSYTVLGDAVNLGARLEGLTKYYGVDCLIGEQTHAHIRGFLCRLVDRVRVKGKEVPVLIYEPLCRETEASDALKALVADYHEACASYLSRDWDRAEARFHALRERDPDTWLYRLYLERIAELRGGDLPPDWDGTYRHTVK